MIAPVIGLGLNETRPEAFVTVFDFRTPGTSEGPRRLGLVLEGGGAKGAFGVGCLKALAVAGVKCDAVAGTSIGAINAAVWSTGCLAAAEEFWSTLRVGNVIGVGLGFPLALLASLIHVWLAQSGVHLPAWDNLGRDARRAVLWFTLWTAPLGWFVYVSRTFGIANDAVAILANVCFAGALITGVRATHLSVKCGLSLAWISLARPTRLRRAIDAILGDRPMQIPTFATLGQETRIVDPCHSVRLVATDQTGAILADIEEPEQIVWLPTYVRLDLADRNERLDMLMASAALPFGLFPQVTVNGSKYADGGFADNIPVLPLLTESPCDDLLIILLRPLEPDWMQDLAKACYMTRHRLQPGREDTDDQNDLASLFSGKRLAVISPSTDLGGHISGTLNFRGSYARRLLCSGFAGMTKAMPELRRADFVGGRVERV